MRTFIPISKMIKNGCNFRKIKISVNDKIFCIFKWMCLKFKLLLHQLLFLSYFSSISAISLGEQILQINTSKKKLKGKKPHII
jgi:hypothetical protein